jgi:hypothetical protein
VRASTSGSLERYPGSVPIVLGAALVLASTSPDVAVADAIEVVAGATCLDDAPLADSVALCGCVGVAAGALRVRGLGFDDARASTVPWVAVGPGFELSIRTRVEGGGPGDTVAASEELPPVGIAVVIGPLARSR